MRHDGRLAAADRDVAFHTRFDAPADLIFQPKRLGDGAPSPAFSRPDP